MQNNVTFSNSNQALAYLQRAYGSQTGQLQAVRKQFWSNVAYPEAGAVEFNFFGSAIGGTGQTRRLTNMPKQNSFGNQHFLLKAIRCDFYITVWDLQAWAFADADTTTLYSDIINGFVQNGVLEMEINARKYMQVPNPFLYCPPAFTQEEVFSAGIDSLTLSEATPNTLNNYLSPAPYATLNPNPRSLYLVDPNILIEAEQNFSVTIDYPSGAILVIGTAVTDDTSAPLYIEVILDGVTFRPVQ
jgi:hypothetical protein